MRVLHVIPSVSAVHGGPSRVLRDMTDALAAQGVEVDVVTTDDDGAGRQLSLRGTTVTDGGVTYRYFARQTRFYRASFPAARWLWHNVGRYDVVHIHAVFSFTSVVAGTIARRRHVPYIVRPLGVLGSWGRQNRRRRLKQVSFRLVDEPVLRGAAAIQWTTEVERDEAADLNLAVRGVTIPNPVPMAAGPPDPPRLPEAWAVEPGQLIVLCLGRIHPVKGVDVLIDAFVAVQQAVPNARLVIAGDGPADLVAGLKARSAQAGLVDVLWTGRVEGEAKRALLQRADVFVQPSRSESFGLAIVEAMGAGKPVVVTDGVGIRSDVRDAGAGLVVPCAAGALADAIVTYLRSPEARQKAGANGRSAARSLYAPEAVARQLVALYTEVATERRAVAP